MDRKPEAGGGVMSSVLTQLVEELNRGTVKVVDLTQPLEPSTPVIGLPPVFAPSPGIAIDVISKYDEKGPAWYWNTIRLGEHTGTHFDAPVHWVTGKDLQDNACDTIPVSRFVGPACVIDVVDDVVRDADFLLTVERLEQWEARHGRVPKGSWVLLRTGWSQRTGAAFINARDDGPHSPGFDARTSRVLAEDRDVLGVGVETIGTDAGQAATFDPPFPNHATMHGAGKFGLASLCNLDQLPATGAIVIAAPLKIVNGSGSPVRAIALVPA
ncbi:MAG TPA: cyclase family protein [Vicinamibacterales bacterium]|jgi:kynurenine formamidase|nr:cyclase family protein [Vicinamibacterales bacterium]